eukprot:NODE_12550_length_1217_cov_22.135780.p1 GENE.NODE_12550_length_1217_cov_22.135780~~NODE_12550_length_1217_cov_22.135780.p1  ORF type:complete len:294 (+),score=57.63 NODE_12550_length_1217_cov_22.135780:32-883(+)
MAAIAALPLNVTWLWGLEMIAQRRLPWPLGGELSATNHAYRVTPLLPDSTWYGIYLVHWLFCLAWAAATVLPKEPLLVYFIFALLGLARQPYTTAWWTLFITALTARGSMPVVEGVTACCALTMLTSYYGLRMLKGHVLRALIRTWAIEPAQRYLPCGLAQRLVSALKSPGGYVLAWLGDLCIHLIAGSFAVWYFRASIDGLAAAVALPTSFIWLLHTGSRSLPATNDMYGVWPELPYYCWLWLYSSHVAICTLLIFCNGGVGGPSLLTAGVACIGAALNTAR